jgi:hypothetical protein
MRRSSGMGVLGFLFFLLLLVVVGYFAYHGWVAKGKPVPTGIEIHTDSADNVLPKVEKKVEDVKDSVDRKLEDGHIDIGKKPAPTTPAPR